jgi:hypothetical protein
VIGLLVLALAALACNVLPGGDSDTDGGDTGGAAAGDGGGDVGGGGDDDVPLTYTGIDASSFSSYRSQFEMTFVGNDDTGAPMDVRYSISQAYSSDPLASALTMDAVGEGMPGETGNIQLIQIGNTAYGVSEGECISYSSDEVVADSQTFSPDDFLMGADFSGAQRVLPNENVNGVMTRHYRFSENAVNLAPNGLTNVHGDMWVAVDGGYAVRQTISADGAAVAFGGAQGHLEWTYDLLDVNVPVGIEAPAGCDAAGTDMPTMPDAAEVTSMGGFVSYTTASPSADVVAFYQAEMAAQGWAAGQASTDTPGFATLGFTRDAETASVLITESEGVTTVIVTVE